MAQREATLEQATTIDIRHLLIALAELPASECASAHVLNGHGVTAQRLKTLPMTDSNPAPAPTPVLSDSIKRTLERAAASAQKRHDKTLASAHLLVGALDDADAHQLLEQLDVATETVRAALQSLHDWNEP